MSTSNKDIFAMAWPLALKAIMLHGIVVIDAYLVSPLGEDALAAMGLAGAIAGLLLGVLFAFSNATQIRIAQAFGSGGPVGQKTAIYCGLLINLVATLVGLALVFGFSGRILTSFAPSPWIADQAQAYLSVFYGVILVEAVGQCLSSHFNGCGRTKISFQSYLIALPINIVVSLMLIHGYAGAPQLGIVGAAYGTVVASVVRVMFMGWIFWRDDRGFTNVSGWSRGSFGQGLSRHLTFSWPIAATFISMSIGNQVCILIYAKMTLTDFVAITLVAPWVQVLGTFGMAWAQATGIAVAQLLGQKTGEKELDAFLSRAWRAAFVAAGLVSAAYLVFCLSSGRIYQHLQPETYQALWMFLPILLILPFPKGSNAICGQTLRASGDTLRVMNIFIGGQWLCKVPLTVLLVIYLDASVFWVFSLFLAEEIFKFPLFHARLFKGRWKTATVSI